MTYRPPAIREAIDLTEALYGAAARLEHAAFTFGKSDSGANQASYYAAVTAAFMACTKLIEHLEQMARSERGAA